MSVERVRMCVLEKSPSGYGFHLHSEKARPGQFVRLVEPGSPAEKSGLLAGDRIIRVCGEDVLDLGHQQVVNKIRAATEQLTLEVERTEEQDEAMTNKVTDALKELRPRLCYMKKGLNGYGFNLHSDKTKPGQFVRVVDCNSPAEQAGLLANDRILEVNGESMVGKQHADVVNAIKSVGDEAILLVVDPETDSFFNNCNVIPGRDHLSGPLPEKVANGNLEKDNKRVEEHNEDSLSSLKPLSTAATPLQETQKDLVDSFPVTATDVALSADPPLDLNMSLAVAKERAHQKRSQKKAPSMDWSKRKEVFSSL
ncbi:Na(+)/H(+) exchange regulatory cofactor NHE-RF1 isoform X2 [Spea bombifrons]|uniref:Na(+)/H(+) exchange regulatory cofactor NHE-RF1 isoform X2 n=1 Tax=Spea bombifrons TaxID=233779 RepID=UPI0023493D14|nr:Na(+)/H(+) exchange regulatory cofactor NHE-RF1 isoform X2 [Spea bombifrons]